MAANWYQPFWGTTAFGKARMAWNSNPPDKEHEMSTYTTLLERNRAFADTYPGVRPNIQPALRTVLLCCADHRTDPAHVLGLKPNEVGVLRNPGGRVTPEILLNLALVGTVAAIEKFDPDYELIVMQHTDCGITRLTLDDHSELLARYFGTTADQLPSRHHRDPRAAVRADVELLQQNPFVPRSLTVSGLLYDVDTGRVETVVPPVPLGE